MLIQEHLVFRDTEKLLKITREGDNSAVPRMSACIILLLEGCDLTRENPFDFYYNENYQVKHRDLIGGCKRTLVKFYRKRAPCSCLDDAHAELKPQSATGTVRALSETSAVADAEGLQWLQIGAVLFQRMSESRLAPSQETLHRDVPARATCPDSHSAAGDGHFFGTN